MNNIVDAKERHMSRLVDEAMRKGRQAGVGGEKERMGMRERLVAFILWILLTSVLRALFNEPIKRNFVFKIQV
jgi:hypothetical protein